MRRYPSNEARHRALGIMKPQDTPSYKRAFVETINLEAMRIVQAQLVDEEHESCGMDIQAVMERRYDMFHAMMLTLKATVAGKKVDSKEVRYPKDWWQAFKARWFHKRLLKKFPVQETVVLMEASAYYPGIVIPKHAAFVQVRVYRP